MLPNLKQNSEDHCQPHPFGIPCLEYAEAMGVDPPPATDFELLEGEGIRATIHGTTVHVGSEKLARRLLAQAEAARRTDAAVLEARRALRSASRAVVDANREALPRRMVDALRRREAAALRALEEADAAARGNTQQMLPSAVGDDTTATVSAPNWQAVETHARRLEYVAD